MRSRPRIRESATAIHRPRAGRRRIPALPLALVVCGLLIGALALSSCARSRRQDSPPIHPDAITLPTVLGGSDEVLRTARAIWPQTAPPRAHEVALFRQTFNVPYEVEQAELAIFADTRYVAWLDGQWLGRGPARFSAELHEYDEIPLQPLAQGEHTLAILVQWAPNARRSESRQPHLIAEIHGNHDGELVVVAATDPAWRAVLSQAWRPDAAPVHETPILGPTELLDLNALQADWTGRSFDDEDWPFAVQQPLDPEPAYALRTIPLLANVPIPYTILDAGLLSPGYEIVQLPPDRILEFSANKKASITVEIPVEAATGTPIAAQLDGAPVRWLPAQSDRPDVVRAAVPVGRGSHRLAFDVFPSYGLPVSIGPADVVDLPIRLEQGAHAGRRLLLADPVTERRIASTTMADSSGSMDIDIADGPAYLVLDLGRVVHGRVHADITGAQGTLVDIGWDERLYKDTLRPLPHPGSLHSQWNQVDSWILDGQTREITTIDARAGRYVLIGVWGDGAALRGLSIQEERYPVETRGWFQSSNERLDAIWQLGVNTAYPSLQDAYADPWRERGQWWGDAYVADHVNEVVFGDSLLLRRGLRAIAAAADPDGNLPAFAPNSDSARMVDYGMLWVQSLQDYVERTDDVSLAHELFPALQGYLAYLETLRRQDTKLLDIPVAHWSQSAVVDWAGTLSRYGQSTALNSLYVGTLRDAARIAEANGDDATAAVWRSRSEEVQRAINDLLYLTDEGRYASSILDSQVVTPTTHAQAWPLAMGVVPETQVDAVASAVLDGFRVEIFGMFWVLEGLGRAGKIEHALDLIEEHYGAMLDRGATTLWEHWDSDQRYYAALSHAWGAGPTWFLTTYVLGIRQTGPMTWSVQPAFAGVSHAAGAHPLENGEVLVRWDAGTCDQHTVEVTAPAGSQGEIVIPIEGVTSVTANNVVIWQDTTAPGGGATAAGGLLRLPMPGTHATIAVDLDCNAR